MDRTISVVGDCPRGVPAQLAVPPAGRGDLPLWNVSTADSAPDRIRSKWSRALVHLWLLACNFAFRGKLTCFVLLAILCVGLFLVSASAQDLTVSKRRDDTSPWGVAVGAEGLSAYPIFNPLLKQAGVRWLRAFFEWQTIEPRQGYWNFALQDHLVENARTNNIHLVGTFAYLAPWASANGGTRRFPIKNIQLWRDYVAGMVARYHSDIKYWEVWNEFDGSFAENGSPKIYAELVREASIAAKKIDPTAKVGMSVANFDVNFLDAAIKAGAANHFDYICVHPYEKLHALSYGGEGAFLAMAGTLRQMLASNQQPADIPLWITEIGSQAPTAPNAAQDELQASLLAKAYLLSIASGFQRIFWFEARGPSGGNGADFGILRADMTARPSYQALKAMTAILGPSPTAVGRINLGAPSYAFVFQTGGNYVLSAWTDKKDGVDVSFATDVRIADLKLASQPLPAGKLLHLTDDPQLILDVPGALIQQARLNQMKDHASEVAYPRTNQLSVQLQTINIDNGMTQISPETTVANGGSRRTDISRADGEGHYVYFRVDPSLAPFGTKDIQIVATVRRLSQDHPAGLSINYESQKGYVNTSYSNIPADDGWHDIYWKITDASFVGAWGWNFRLDAISSPNDFLIKQVRVNIGP